MMRCPTHQGEPLGSVILAFAHTSLSRSLVAFTQSLTTTFRLRALFGIKKKVLKRGEADRPIAPGSGSGLGESKNASASEQSCGFQPDAQDDSGPGVAGDGELVKAARGISDEGRLVLQGLIAAFSQVRAGAVHRSVFRLLASVLFLPRRTGIVPRSLPPPRVLPLLIRALRPLRFLRPASSAPPASPKDPTWRRGSRHRCLCLAGVDGE